MHILYTNYDMHNLGGSTLYVCDMALEMKRRGHTVSCFSLRLGRAAEKLMAQGITVTSDLNSLQQPDVIHAHHPLETRLAAAKFPHTPLVYASLGPTHPLERPNQAHNCITRYIAISEEVRRMLIREEGVIENEVSIVPNFVDLNNFTPQNPINECPRKVLLLTTYFSTEGMVRGACELAGNLELKQIGQGELVWNVSDYIEWADVVITSGRGALEAMAMGRAVIVFRLGGSDGLIRPDNFEVSLASNFNGHSLNLNLTVEQLAEHMLGYNLADVETLKETVRSRFATEKVAEKLLEVYETTIEEYKARWTPGKIEERLTGIISDLSRTLVRYKDIEAAKGHTELLLAYLQAERENLRVREQDYLNRLNSLSGRENFLTQKVNTLEEKIVELTAQNLALQNKLEEALVLQTGEQTIQAQLALQLWKQKNEAVQKAEELDLLLNQVSQGKIMKLLNFATWLLTGLLPRKQGSD